MKIAMLLYANMTALDFVGPFEVFGIMPKAKILTVAKEAGPSEQPRSKLRGCSLRSCTAV